MFSSPMGLLFPNFSHQTITYPEKITAIDKQFWKLE